MIPNSNGTLKPSPITFVRQPSFTYRLIGDQISGNIDGVEAIRQAVFHILSTERYAYAIYDSNYGVEFEQYKGRSFSYLEATIEETLKSALLQDDRITDVKVTNVSKTDIDSALVEFIVAYDGGTFNMEAKVNV